MTNTDEAPPQKKCPACPGELKQTGRKKWRCTKCGRKFTLNTNKHDTLSLIERIAGQSKPERVDAMLDDLRKINTISNKTLRRIEKVGAARKKELLAMREAATVEQTEQSKP